MIDEKLDAIQRRYDAVTPRPWQSWIKGRDHRSADKVIITGGGDIYLSARHRPTRISSPLRDRIFPGCSWRFAVSKSVLASPEADRREGVLNGEELSLSRHTYLRLSLNWGRAHNI